MKADIEPLFVRMRDILRRHSGPFAVVEDTSARYCLQHGTHPISRQPMYVAWTHCHESFVSLHHLGIVDLLGEVSPDLGSRRNGKGGVHLHRGDETLLPELERLVARGFEIIAASSP